MEKQQPSYDISVQFKGETYSAWYSVQSNTITVDSSYGSKSTQLGELDTHILAPILFREILISANRRGELDQNSTSL